MNKVLYVVVVIFVVLLSFIGKLYRNNKSFTVVNQMLADKIDYMNNYKITATLRMKEMVSNHKQIPLATELIDEEGKTIKLCEVVRGNTLVFHMLLDSLNIIDCEVHNNVYGLMK